MVDVHNVLIVGMVWAVGLHVWHESVEEIRCGPVDTREDVVGFFHEKGHLTTDCRVAWTTLMLNS